MQRLRHFRIDQASIPCICEMRSTSSRYSIHMTWCTRSTHDTGRPGFWPSSRSILEFSRGLACKGPHPSPGVDITTARQAQDGIDIIFRWRRLNHFQNHGLKLTVDTADFIIFSLEIVVVVVVVNGSPTERVKGGQVNPSTEQRSWKGGG